MNQGVVLGEDSGGFRRGYASNTSIITRGETPRAASPNPQGHRQQRKAATPITSKNARRPTSAVRTPNNGATSDVTPTTERRFQRSATSTASLPPPSPGSAVTPGERGGGGGSHRSSVTQQTESTASRAATRASSTRPKPLATTGTRMRSSNTRCFKCRNLVCTCLKDDKPPRSTLHPPPPPPLAVHRSQPRERATHPTTPHPTIPRAPNLHTTTSRHHRDVDADDIETMKRNLALRTPYQVAKRKRMFTEIQVSEAQHRGHVEAMEEVRWESLEEVFSHGPQPTLEQRRLAMWHGEDTGSTADGGSSSNLGSHAGSLHDFLTRHDTQSAAISHDGRSNHPDEEDDEDTQLAALEAELERRRLRHKEKVKSRLRGHISTLSAPPEAPSYNHTTTASRLATLPSPTPPGTSPSVIPIAVEVTPPPPDVPRLKVPVALPMPEILVEEEEEKVPIPDHHHHQPEEDEGEDEDDVESSRGILTSNSSVSVLCEAEDDDEEEEEEYAEEEEGEGHHHLHHHHHHPPSAAAAEVPALRIASTSAMSETPPPFHLPRDDDTSIHVDTNTKGVDQYDEKEDPHPVVEMPPEPLHCDEEEEYAEEEPIVAVPPVARVAPTATQPPPREVIAHHPPPPPSPPTMAPAAVASPYLLEREQERQDLQDRLRMLELQVSDLSSDNRILLLSLASSQREVSRLATEGVAQPPPSAPHAAAPVEEALPPSLKVFKGEPRPAPPSKPPRREEEEEGSSEDDTVHIDDTFSPGAADRGSSKVFDDDRESDGGRGTGVHFRDEEHISGPINVASSGGGGGALTVSPHLPPQAQAEIPVLNGNGRMMEEWHNPFSQAYVVSGDPIPQPTGVARGFFHLFSHTWDACCRRPMDDHLSVRSPLPAPQLPERPPPPPAASSIRPSMD